MKLRILDATRNTLIVPDVLKIDTAREPISIIQKNLNNIADNGIWLSPYRGIPEVQGIPELDIVYVDPHFRVVRCLEGYRHGSMTLSNIAASSAFILPLGCASAARVQPGDKLELRDAVTGSLWAGSAEEMDQEALQNADLQRQPKPEPKGLRRAWARLMGLTAKSLDRRRAERHAIPGLVAYFSLTRLRERFGVKTISTEGFYVLTEERWPLGTSIMVGLEVVNAASQQVEAAISVQSKVVSVGPDGVGFAFDDDPTHRDRLLTVTSVEEWQQLKKFLEMIKN